jgi:hypothetical protein
VTDPNHCATCGAWTDGTYRCPACTAKAEAGEKRRVATATPPAQPIDRVTNPFQRMQPFDLMGSLIAGLFIAAPERPSTRWLVYSLRAAVLAYAAFFIGWATYHAMTH